MNGRIKALEKRCANRGGDCPCVYNCQALGALDVEISRVKAKQKELADELDILEQSRKRLKSPMATLKPDFKFESNLTPVIHFDGDEAMFGYEDSDGEWIEQDIWPFEQEVVWADDCERLGFKVA